jgi:hypothetical protein
MRRVIVPVFAAAAVLAVAACAAPIASDRVPAASESTTPIAACPEQPGVELPPECAPYDPEGSMALNDLYRQRIDLPADAQESADMFVEPVTAALEELRAEGPPFTEDGVRAALEAEGLLSVQTRSGAGDVLFGAQPPAGGCVYGALEAERVTVDVGGYIMDGGCLPAQ